MRLAHVLAGGGIAAALFVSIALVVRDLPAGKPAKTQAVPPVVSAPAPSPATRPPAVQKPTPAVPKPAPVVAAPPPPARTAPPQTKPGNLFDLESLPSPGVIGPGAPPPGLSRTPSPQINAANADRGAPTTRLQLTPEQSAKISYVLLSHTITQAEVANFPLRVGGKVPPEVVLTPLPRDVADAIPAYSHYSYVIAQNQIVIVVTERGEIDTLIPL